MERIQQAAGLVLQRGEPNMPKFLGSCFSFRRRDMFLTAHHCIADSPEGSLIIGMPAHGNALEGSLPVSRVFPHSTADLAVLIVDPGPERAPYSMSSLDWAAGWRESIVAFGYPEDTAANGVMPTPRMSRGNIQRFYEYDDGRGTYTAIEMSFPAPQGLSGSPVSRTQDTGAVVGVVAANHTALTYRGGYDVTDDRGTYHVAERDVIRYGIAVYLPPLEGWINECVLMWDADQKPSGG